MIKRVLAIIVDYYSRGQAEKLSCQLARDLPADCKVDICHVDNGNHPAVELSERQKQFGIHLLSFNENHHYAGALNKAITEFESRVQQESPQSSRKNSKQYYDAYWFLNPDLILAPGCLGKLVNALNENPKAGAVGPVVYLGNGPKVWGARGVVSPFLGVTAMTDWRRKDPLPKWSYLPGCSLLTRSEAYHAVGPVPERYKFDYEETEYCILLQKKGWELRVEPSAEIFHLVDSRKGHIPSTYYAFYFARNNLYFWQKNFGIPWYVQVPRTAFVITKELVLPLRRAANLSQAMERLKYAFAGFLDGFVFLKTEITPREIKLFTKK